MKSISLSLSSVLLFILLAFVPSEKVFADHLGGAEITYQCTATPGIYEVTLIIYRDCSGIPMCSGGCGSSCLRTISIMGASPGCSTSSFGSITLSLQNVRDVDINTYCPNAKSICTDNGCATPGTYTPAYERYEFKGLANIGPTSSIPASCCNVRFVFDECCRSGYIETGATWQDFYTDATVNRCLSGTPCNNSPVFKNDPLITMCGGQNVVFNNGAFDPDHDSLSFAFAPALQGYNSPVSYDPPWAYNRPMPWTGAWDGIFPAGISCNPLNGDILFTPNNAMGSNFYGVMVTEVKQWKTINGVPTLMGITRRDMMSIVLGNCAPNNSPRLITSPPLGTNPNAPQTQWQACAGQQLCFNITAKDTDFNPPTISDTTFLTWDSTLAFLGATFTPNYIDSNRRQPAPIGGPREDSYQFCWTPDSTMISPYPYYFTVTAKDSRCPKAGTLTRAFSVQVLGFQNVSIAKSDAGCGKWSLNYAVAGAGSTASVAWQISKEPFDYDLTQSPYTFGNVQTLPPLRFSKPGKYLIKLDVSSSGSGAFCSGTIYDTLSVVDSALALSVKDTMVCYGSSIALAANVSSGKAPYHFKWYKSIRDTASSALDTTSLFTVTPDSTRRYTVIITDSAGCKAIDSINVLVSPGISQTITTNLTCNGGNDGSIVFKQKDSTAAYQYQLNGGTAQSTGTFNNLAAGTYSVVVHDTHGCSRTFSNMTLTEPTAIKDTLTKSTDETCFNSNNGSISTIILGGVPTYMYKLDSGSYTAPKVYNSLRPGTYTVYVKDSKGCMYSFSRTIARADSISQTLSKTNLTCSNSNNGTLTINASGGKAPYLYRLGSGAFSSTHTYSGLSAALYSITIKDSNNCQKTISEWITQPSALSYSAVKQNISCSPVANGSVRITASGGIPPYLYNIDNGAFDTLSVKTNLIAGLHSFSIKDSNNCILSFTQTITEPSSVVYNVTKENTSCFGRADGKITVAVTSGKPPYQYKINSQSFTSNNMFTALPVGDYTIQIKDSFNCIQTTTASITSPPQIIAGAVTGDASVLKNTTHTYQVAPQSGLNYLWSAQMGSITSGQATSSADIRWDSVGTGAVKVVVYSDSTCGDSGTLSVTIGTTGLNEVASQLGLEVFPNPTKNILNITLKKLPEERTLILYDVQGKIVMEQPLKEQQQLNLEQLPQGVYMLKIADWRGQIIKQ